MSGLFDPLAAGFRLEGDNDEAVVLVHGFTGTAAHFRPLGHALNELGYTVVAPLLAGHGTRLDDLENVTADDWIASVAGAVAEVAEHGRIHLVGLSMGGLISLVLAGRTGAASVTTISSPVIVRDKTAYLAPVAHRLSPLVEWPDRGEPDLDDEVRPYWLTYSGFPTRAAGQMLVVLRRALVAAGRLDIPSLVIQSRTDESVSPVSARILSGLLGKNCWLVWLRNSLHAAVLDRERDLIAAAVVDRMRTA